MLMTRKWQYGNTMEKKECRTVLSHSLHSCTRRPHDKSAMNLGLVRIRVGQMRSRPGRQLGLPPQPSDGNRAFPPQMNATLPTPHRKLISEGNNVLQPIVQGPDGMTLLNVPHRFAAAGIEKGNPNSPVPYRCPAPMYVSQW